MGQEKSVDPNAAVDKPSQADALVEQAQAGDRQAFHRLVDIFQPEIFRMVYYRTRSRMDAEDLTQDIFLKAFKHIGRLESIPLFRSWLYRIAVNRVRDHYRARRIKSLFGLVSMESDDFHESEVIAEAPLAPEQLERKDFWARVRTMLDGLSRLEREAFMLRFFDQLSIKEMTAAMGSNESTVKTHLYRALRKVKAAAGDAWEET
jgi:RNA polymerase sigma-70 factor, ECF subfamily